MKRKLYGLVLVFVAVILCNESKSYAEAPIGHQIKKRSSDDTTEIDLYGEYYWELLYHVNTNKNTSYLERRKYNKSITTSYTDLRKSVLNASLKLIHMRLIPFPPRNYLTIKFLLSVSLGMLLFSKILKW